ncbi:hypothetical protein ACQEU8_00745 [Streptomyces sp. CA-250714]|uniref:hypothetical protein n=1 Tax=Streptomyces sp. CA-250714 TaxID=3240060 RepID=UPI003D8C732E
MDDTRVSTLLPSSSGHGLAMPAVELVSSQFFAETPRTELTDVLAPYLQRRGLDPASRDFPRQHRLLDAAARDGQLLAARVPCIDYTAFQNACRP